MSTATAMTASMDYRSQRSLRLTRKREAAAMFGMIVSYLASTSPAVAASTRSRDAELARCISSAANGRPWLEQTLWGLRDQEGGWPGAEVRNADGSHDLGPLQVNSWWVSRLAAVIGRPPMHVRWWLTHDTCFNVSSARWIFLSGLTLTRDYWKAVGVYHSPTSWRQLRYSSSVADHLRRRYGAKIFRSRPERSIAASGQ